MTQATAYLPSGPCPKVYVPPGPLLLLDGQPTADFKTLSYVADAPLDERSAELALSGDQPPLAIASRQATLTLPIRLANGQTHWPVLVSGKLSMIDDGSGDRWTLIDDWSSRLAKPPASTLWQEADGRFSQRPALGAFLDAQAGKGNRSAQTRRIDGSDLHLLSELDDQPWTLRQALALVSAIADLRLDFSRFPCSPDDWTLSRRIPLNRPAGQILQDLLEPWGLMIHREMIWQGRTLIEHRLVQRPPWGLVMEIGPSWPATSMTIDQSPLSGRLWIAQASGWRVEGTFALRPGWDRSLQGQPIERYGQSDPQFADYANVYRFWVLNEDGRFTGEPYDNDQAFDLTAFFAGDQAIEPTPIPFQNSLTLDDSRQQRKPRVEVSLDGGANWSPYAGQVSIRSDRAAVYFSDAVLPSNLLSAAVAETLAVRVTASLTSPLPVTIRRWQGNPFACTNQPRLLATEAFAFRKVHSSSVHFADVQTGQRPADQANDHRAMERWLIQQMDRSSAMPASDQAEIRLNLPTVNPLWNVGDRLTGAQLTQHLSELGDQAAEPWTIRHLACRWPVSASSDSGMKITLTPSH